MQVMQAEPPPAAPPAPRGQLVTLHDGRQVDSWSEDWRRECLARYLTGVGSREREDWLQSLLGDQYFAQEMRQLMHDMRVSKRRSQ